jgi:hypothetical protein
LPQFPQMSNRAWRVLGALGKDECGVHSLCLVFPEGQGTGEKEEDLCIVLEGACRPKFGAKLVAPGFLSPRVYIAWHHSC